MATALKNSPPDPWDLLHDVGEEEDADIDVAEAALALGVLDRPGVVIDKYRHHLERLASEFRPGKTADATARAKALAEFLGHDMGYRGDDRNYDNLENANLLSVIDRRRGLPVALAILYLHVARACGWQAAAINFPGHVLFRIDGDRDRVMLDPFGGGRVVTPRDLRDLLKVTAGHQAELKPVFYEPLTNRALLVRLQSNIKIRVLKLGDMAKAADVLRRIVAVAPMEVDAWYELGVLLIHLDQVREGRNALETCLARLDYVDGRAGLRTQVMQTLSELAASLD